MGASGLEHGHKAERVRGDDLIRVRGLAGHNQLVAGRDQGDHWFAGHRDVCAVHRSEKRQISGT